MTLRYITQSGHWPSGNPRCYIRRTGLPRLPLPDLPMHSPGFLAAYAAALGRDTLPPATAPTGSIAAAVTAFLRSDTYHSVAPATRSIWRRGLDDITTRYGTAKMADLEARHIRLDIARLKPNPANARLKIWRALCRWCAEVGITPTDAAQGIQKTRTAQTDGHSPWSREDVAKFRAHWPIESPQRLALEAMFWTGARTSDAVRLSDAMIDREGWLTFRQQKTGGEVAIPLRRPSPAFAEEDGHLAAALAARPVRHIVWMVTAHGKPRSVKATSQWFAAAARAAGIEGKTAHGLRKLRAQIMAENGATAHQIAAWTGHKSLSEVEHYSKSADRKRILGGTEADHKLPTFSKTANSE